MTNWLVWDAKISQARVAYIIAQISEHTDRSRKVSGKRSM